MNYSFVARRLSSICLLFGVFMLCTIPWSLPMFGGDWAHESDGVFGLFASFAVCLAAGLLLRFLGRGVSESYSKKEATAVVGLTWILATLLGALPYLFSGTERLEGVPMSVCDALFESQSGFSTTGATVFGELERSDLLPRCILFWRCTTHFLGGLGIMVLFVVLLGFGSGTKNIMRFEMTGISKSSQSERLQQLVKIVFCLYAGMNLVLTLLLVAQGLSFYDAICHAFSTISTGGFSTFNASAGHFAVAGYRWSESIEWTLAFFMFLGGTNFILLYWFCIGKPGRLLGDTEWRTYVGVILAAVTIIFLSGWISNDFDNFGTADRPFYTSGAGVPDESGRTPVRESLPAVQAFRVTVFQVVSIITTTGFCTDEFEKWSGLSCCAVLILMFIGGCAGSTSGGFKVIRAVCLVKTLPHEIELSYRPNVVRPVLIGKFPIDKEVVRHVMVHFTLLVSIFVAGTFLVLIFEPISTWGEVPIAGDRKLIDTASAVASCLNNVGPGLGLIGARQNYGVFGEISKFLFTTLMMLGRLEMFVILSMFHPGFWRRN